tara:strand:+ start:525 stop:1622 length:1098 start_codon:yes stop_codon:yes gene_type:complete
MNVCIIGGGLTSLSLAKVLIKKKIKVHNYQKKISDNILTTRTLGISKDNFEFFKKEIINIPKNKLWNINKIEIFTEKLHKDKIINFERSKDDLFYIFKNDSLYKLLSKKLSKDKFFKKKIIKHNNFYDNLLKKNKYDLIINCDSKNIIAKKFFLKKVKKRYNNIAYTTILNHEKIRNNTAVQIFTKHGPIAFLPISNLKTSVVYSFDVSKKRYSEKKIIELIKNYNPKYNIKKIANLSQFELNSSTLRNYYYKNITAFGDCLHTIHPLAGQGFNMTIRDIKIFSNIIKDKMDLGLQLDSIVLDEFEKKTKHINFIFSNGIDFIYEFFNFDKKIENENLNKLLKFFGNKKILNDYLIKYADKGIKI